MRRSIVRSASLVFLTVVAVFSATTPLVAEDPPQDSSKASLAGRLAEKREAPERFDQPDRASAYWAAQRIPEGETAAEGTLDVFELYEKARLERDRMPGYVSADGRRLPPGAKAELGRWEFLGPGNIGGRTRALLIHPQKARIRYAAGVSGGIWKTVDAGASWRPIADLLPNIAVSAMVMDPEDPDTIYAGTGEGHFREVVRETSLPLRGLGIFKTIDGGATWERLESTKNGDFAWVNALAISTSDPRRVYAATRSGVWRSRNGGRTWQHILDPDVQGGCFDLEIRTDRPSDILFTSCGTFEQGAVYRNPRAQVGGPAGWVPVLSEPGMGRTSLALAPSNQNVIFAISASYLRGPGGNFEGGLHAVFRSDAAGTPGSWRAVNRNTDTSVLDTLLLTNPSAALAEECGFGGTGFFVNLGWYANTIAVDPTDENVVFAGGVDLFRSDDGGQSWGTVSFWWSGASAHADQHVIAFHPGYDGAANQVMFLGGDGGVYVTPNARARKATGNLAPCDISNSAVAWTAQNNHYGVTQFYHGAVFSDGASYFGGTQDNGTLRGRDGAGVDGWFRILGGDGGYVAIDPRNENVLYGESQGLALRKSTDGGLSWQRKVDGIEDTSGVGNDTGDLLFIVPFTLDPNDPDRLWYGGRRLWRTDDGAESWRQAAAAWPGGGRLSAVAVASGDPSRVVVGLDDGTIHATDAALSSTAATVWPSSRPRAGFVSWVAFDPSNPLRVYATYATFGGRHLWASDDGGSTWRPLDGRGPGRLPNLPAHSVVVDPDDPDRLFIGTDLGVFVTTDRGESFAAERAGFANTVVESLEILRRPSGGTWLFAFTHGRGVWRTRVAPSP